MEKRPNPDSNTQVAGFMNLFGLTEEEARDRLRHMQHGYDIGRKAGQAEAQRFFRLALGVELPDMSERALWNNPVPLRQDDGNGDQD